MNGKDKITKMNNMEIKVGDKVRVREDAPMETRLGEIIPTKRDFTVTGIGKNYAEVKLIGSLLPTYYPVLLKYLVKVDAEAKEAKIKVGDIVEELVSRKKGRVLGIEGDFVVVGFPYDKEKNYWHIDSVELVEPTEQTEVEEEAYVGSIKIPVEVDLTDNYWDAYTADLAKEITVKVAKKYTDPKETAEYAVSVAKAVAEGLKRK